MSHRIIRMERAMAQAKRAGHDPRVVIPKGMKRKSLLKLFEKQGV